MLGVACGLLLAGCTLSFDAPTDGGRTDARVGETSIDATRAESGIDAETPDAADSAPIDLDGFVPPDTTPGDTGTDGAACNPASCPSVPCGAPICQVDGRCGIAPSPMGTSCDDGDPCTTGGTCNSVGMCVGASGCVEDDNPCTTIACTPRGCEARITPDGSMCPSGSDESAMCCAGGCVDTMRDADHCGSCANRCSTGLCRDGSCAACLVDADCALATLTTCTSEARCVAGSCSYTVRPTHCLIMGVCYADGETASGNPCRVCIGGSESWTTRTTCDDGDFCTENDVCVDLGIVGRCDPGPARDCDDRNSCTLDSCNESANRCDHVSRPSGSSCDDGDRCTTSDECDDRRCAGRPACPAPGPCERSLCDTGTGACSIEYLTHGTPCNDGDPCTTGESCRAGMGGVTVCRDGNPTCRDPSECEAASCDMMTGACSSSPQPFGTPCTDSGGCSSMCDGGGSCIFVCGA